MAEEKFAASAAGYALRMIPSTLRDAAQLDNLVLARAARLDRAKPCACRVVRSDGIHESACPVYQRDKQREYRKRNKS